MTSFTALDVQPRVGVAAAGWLDGLMVLMGSYFLENESRPLVECVFE